jgi:uncharacterized protein YkwD
MSLRRFRCAVLLAACALVACRDGYYSQDPKVAGAVAAAAGGIAVAQGIAAHSADVSAGSSFNPPLSDDLPPIRDYALRAINRIRAEHALSPLTPSTRLNEFAQGGSEWLEGDHRLHGHLQADARSAGCQENQGNPWGEPAAPPEVQIDAALARMMSSDPESRANLLSTRLRFVGIGVSGRGGAMYLTLDFTEVAF